MSECRELQELQGERTRLEDESRSLREERKKLEERARALEERVIEELKCSNDTARQAISQLESRIHELEKRLGQVSEGPEASKPADEAASSGLLKECVKCGKGIPAASEECQYCGTLQTRNPEPAEVCAEASAMAVEEPRGEAVSVTALEDSVAGEGEAGEGLGQGSEKKKRRFF